MGFGTEEKQELIGLIEEAMWVNRRIFFDLEGMEWGQEEGLSWLLTPDCKEGINCIFEVNLAPDQADSGIDRIVRRYRQCGLYPSWWLGPSANPGDLPERLAARGFREEELLSGMALDLTRPLPEASVPAGLKVTRTEDSGKLLDMMEIFALAVGITPLEGRQEHRALMTVGLGPDRPRQHFVGLVEDKVVSSSSFNKMGETAAVDYVSTGPDHRSRGYAKAVLLAALREAGKRGCTKAVLQATEMGKPLYLKLGFEDLCPFSIWSDRPADDNNPD